MSLAEKIEAKCAAFAREMTELVMQAVTEAFGAPPRALKSVSTAAKPGKGVKRTPEAISNLGAELQDFISSNPGQRIEQIAKGMRCDTRDLVLPAKKLLTEGWIRTEGQKRATRYHPLHKAAHAAKG